MNKKKEAKKAFSAICKGYKEAIKITPEPEKSRLKRQLKEYIKQNRK